MSRYVPPSKRKEVPLVFDTTTLASDRHFPSLGIVQKKEVKTGFKDVIEERLRQEAEDAIRAAAPPDFATMSYSEREAHGIATLIISGNTKEEFQMIAESLYAFDQRANAFRARVVY